MGSDSNKVIDCRAYNEIRTQMAQEALVRRPAGTKPKWARMSSVTPKDLLWMWPGRLPLGKMVVLDGDPGLGKSVITLDGHRPRKGLNVAIC